MHQQPTLLRYPIVWFTQASFAWARLIVPIKAIHGHKRHHETFVYIVGGCHYFLRDITSCLIWSTTVTCICVDNHHIEALWLHHPTRSCPNCLVKDLSLFSFGKQRNPHVEDALIKKGGCCHSSYSTLVNIPKLMWGASLFLRPVVIILVFHCFALLPCCCWPCDICIL